MNVNYAFALVLLVLAGFLINIITFNNEQAFLTTKNQKDATTFLIYADSLDEYLSHNQNYQGDAVNLISLPSWLGRDTNIKVYAENGKGYIYTDNKAGLLAALMTNTQNSSNLGVSNQGQIFTNAGVVPKPSYIPNNAVVYIR